MVQFLTEGERKTRRRIARRWVGMGFLVFILIIWAGLLYQSSPGSRNEKAVMAKPAGPVYHFEFRQVRDSDKIDLFINGKFFTAYCYNEHLKKPVLFPVLTASGKTVTRGWPLEPRPFEPVDHPHHYGISLTHGDVNGLDFWSNTDSVPEDRKMHYGSINQQSFLQIKSGNNEGILETACTWDRPDGRTLMDEKSTYIFKADTGLRIIDRITTLTARDIDVRFNDTKEGMYTIRVAREMEQPSFDARIYLDEHLKRTGYKVDNNGITGLYENSEGQSGDDVWGKRARWVILSSRLEGEPVSIIMFDNPKNPNFPAHWMARGYGLFGINAFGSSAYTDGKESLNYFLEAGKSVTFRYRIAIVDGYKPDKQEIERLYNKFIK